MTWHAPAETFEVLSMEEWDDFKVSVDCGVKLIERNFGRTIRDTEFAMLCEAVFDYFAKGWHRAPNPTIH